LDIPNNYFGYPKNGINVNSACHSEPLDCAETWQADALWDCGGRAMVNPLPVKSGEAARRADSRWALPRI